MNASLSDRQCALLSSYMLSIGQGPIAVHKMIMFDMRGFLDLGITERTADLRAVLNAFSSRYPEAGCRRNGTDLSGVPGANCKVTSPVMV